MQNEYGEARINEGEPGTLACPVCRAALIPEMRFCRMCGYRMGEGVEEYAATRRFDGRNPTTAQRPAGAGGAPGMFGQMTPMSTTGLGRIPTREPGTLSKMWSPGRWGVMTWIILSIVILIAVGVIPRTIRRWRAGGAVAVAPAPKSFLGVDGLETADNGRGAFIQGLAAPDTAIERAGLLGGDVITSFDGQAIEDAEGLRRVLAATPVGKTVEVIYIRDGQTAKTTFTTEGEFSARRRLGLLDGRPGGRGVLGVDVGERVRIPGSEIHGVEVDVNRNQPADLAGMKDGDVIIEFGGKPIRTAGDLRLRIYQAAPGGIVPVVVMRGAERIEIPVKVGRSRD